MAQSIIKRHGGKFYLARKHLSQIANHTHSCEVFFGAGHWTLGKPNWLWKGRSEVVNDADSYLTNLFVTIANPFTKDLLTKLAEPTPFSQFIWNRALNIVQNGFLSQADSSSLPNVDLALAYLILNRQSRQGLEQDFATLSRTRTRSGINEQASAWRSCIELIPSLCERLHGVVILNDDFRRVMRSNDDKETYFYLDPPYHPDTRVVTDAYGDYEMSEQDHTDLLEICAGCKGKFALAGYRHPLYDSYAKKYGWRRIDYKIDKKSSAAKVKPKAIDSLWMNYDASQVIPQARGLAKT